MASAGDKIEIQHIIDIPKEIEPAHWPECCIYKVPSSLRELNKDAYTPRLISIGPFHHQNKELKPMEMHKQRYFHFFWNRLPNKQVLVKYKSFLHQNVEKIRRCYAEKIDLEDDQFVAMILLDSVFIMELFLRESERCCKLKGDHILTQSWLSKGIQRDLLLLENQLPIDVLEELFDSVVSDAMEKEHDSFRSLAHEYFSSYYPSIKIKSPDKSFRPKNWEKSIHFTDLIRCSYLPMDFEKAKKKTNKNYESPSETESVLRTATKLIEAGVTFEKVRNRSLIEIEFVKNRYLSWFLCLGCLPYTKCFKARFLLPQLKVLQTTECVLRNLIALEQCHYPEQPYICNYVSLIDSLIHTKDDVELLVENEAIVHELGSDKELATLVNGLCKHVCVEGSTNYYSKTIQDLNKHYNSKWKRAMGTLKWVYFRDPWRSSSTVVGIAVLVFTIFNFCRVIKVVF